MKRKARKIMWIIIAGIMLAGCDLPTSNAVKDREGFADIVHVENFREDAAIKLSWRRDAGADRYILKRSVDGLYGAGEFKTIYDGIETLYTDRDVEADIRYLYRLDKVYNGNIRHGEETSLGVGARGEVDLYEPNNGKETAVDLSGERSGTIYFYRYSDGRTLNDSDWYRVWIEAEKGANLRMIESNAGTESSFYISVPGKFPIKVIANETVRIEHENGESGYIYFGIYPETEMYVASDSTGGTIRSYKVILDSVTGNGDNGDGGSNDDNDDGKDGDNDNDNDDNDDDENSGSDDDNGDNNGDDKDSDDTDNDNDGIGDDDGNNDNGSNNDNDDGKDSDNDNDDNDDDENSGSDDGIGDNNGDDNDSDDTDNDNDGIGDDGDDNKDDDGNNDNGGNDDNDDGQDSDNDNDDNGDDENNGTDDGIGDNNGDNNDSDDTDNDNDENSGTDDGIGDNNGDDNDSDDTDNDNDVVGDDNDPGDIIEQNELFSEISGVIHFLTNDKKYSEKNHTFWRRLSADQTPSGSIKMDLLKESGHRSGGYGFFFREGKVNGSECMLTVLVQTGGMYAIGKVVDGKYEEITAWKIGNTLRQGIGMWNTVEVSWDDEEYVLFLNGVEIDRFRDMYEPRCSGNGSGAAAVVTRQEQFPNNPVYVRYRKYENYEIP